MAPRQQGRSKNQATFILLLCLPYTTHQRLKLKQTFLQPSKNETKNHLKTNLYILNAGFIQMEAIPLPHVEKLMAHFHQKGVNSFWWSFKGGVLLQSEACCVMQSQEAHSKSYGNPTKIVGVPSNIVGVVGSSPLMPEKPSARSHPFLKNRNNSSLAGKPASPISISRP